MNMIRKVKIPALSLLLYCYLCITFKDIVGIPSLNELTRVSRLGEALFNPTINLIPLKDGFSFGFIMNIFLFMPLGFLCPLISKTFERARNTFFIGLGLSVFIEISQMFTLYRATDIDDLITNTIGTMIGYLCFLFIAKRRFAKSHSNQYPAEKGYSAYLVIAIIILAFATVFFFPVKY